MYADTGQILYLEPDGEGAAPAGKDAPLCTLVMELKDEDAGEAFTLVRLGLVRPAAPAFVGPNLGELPSGLANDEDVAGAVPVAVGAAPVGGLPPPLTGVVDEEAGDVLEVPLLAVDEKGDKATRLVPDPDEANTPLVPNEDEPDVVVDPEPALPLNREAAPADGGAFAGVLLDAPANNDAAPVPGFATPRGGKLRGLTGRGFLREEETETERDREREREKNRTWRIRRSRHRDREGMENECKQ